MIGSPGSWAWQGGSPVDRKTDPKTRVVTLTRRDVRNTIAQGHLTVEEERYVRMRFGLSEPATAPLVFSATDLPDLRVRVQHLEAECCLRLGILAPREATMKDRILARLRRD